MIRSKSRIRDTKEVTKWDRRWKVEMKLEREVINKEINEY